MHTLSKFIQIISGSETPGTFSGLVFFAIIGIFLSLLMQTTKRDVSSPATPFCFSFKFLFSDNNKRIVASIILVYIALRFTPDLIGVEITQFYAFVIGYSSDKLSQILKNRTNFLDSK